MRCKIWYRILRGAEKSIMNLKRPGTAILIAFCLLSACASRRPAAHHNGAASPYRFVKEAGGIREYELTRNGLHVLLVPDPSASVSTLMVTYLAGPRQETAGFTGAAHMLEHMMFKGSAKYRKEKGTLMHELLQRRGAFLDATTGADATNYYEILPNGQLDQAIDMEADRMRYALLRKADFDLERSVVMSELELGENDPQEALLNAVWAAAYQTHPYHHPLIGWRKDVNAMPVEQLKAFYDTYYRPNNAVVSVIGNFNPDHVLQKINDRFGRIGTGSARRAAPAGKTYGHRRKRRRERIFSDRIPLSLGFGTGCACPLPRPLYFIKRPDEPLLPETD